MAVKRAKETERRTAMKNINRIIRYATPYFFLINIAICVSARVFHNDVHFGLALSVICPVLCGILSWCAEKNKKKQKRVYTGHLVNRSIQ